jgi:predicted aspartyl protease
MLNWNGQTRIELSLTLDIKGSPTIPARLSGREMMALLDSGASVSSISPEVALAIGARTTRTYKVNGQMYGAAVDVPVQLGTASLTLPLVPVGVMPRNLQLLIGRELLLQAVVDMDFDAGRLTLIHPKAFTPPTLRSVPLKFSSGLPTVELKVNGFKRAICAVLDTGTNAGVHIAADIAVDLALPVNAQRGTRRTQFGGGAEAVMPALLPLEELQIGNHRYQNVPVSQRPVTGRSCSSLLGMAILGRHHLILDLRNNRVWLLPRTSVAG